MAKDNNKLSLPDIAVESEPAKAPEKNPKDNRKKSNKANVKGKKKFSLARLFREVISELKKVEWAPLRRTKNNSGVIAQTGTVLIVVLFFLIVISLFDTGLGELLKLLLNAASPSA